MALHEIQLTLANGALEKELQQIIQLGAERTQTFHDSNRDHPIKGFHSSDFEEACRWLVSLKAQPEFRESRPTFCEWGSGLGIVSLLAEKTGYQATAIELEFRLHQEAIRIHEKFDSHCQCIHGSFIPDKISATARLCLPESSESMWLGLDGPAAYSRIDSSVDSFDVIYAYPLPGESDFVMELFDVAAKREAFLLTFHGAADFRLHQKR